MASFFFSTCSLLLGLAVTLVAAIPQENILTQVNLRIEGDKYTIYEGPIKTKGHDVTTASGGTHHCDGTNNEAYDGPGPTCTSALDDAARQFNFSWDGQVV